MTPRVSGCLALVLLATLSGCTSFIAEQIATAPNADRRAEEILANPRPPDLRDAVIDDSFRVAVTGAGGASPAELAVWVIDANDLALSPTADGFGLGPVDTEQVRQLIEPRGTILILHGFKHRKSKKVYLLWAQLLASSGYRCVLIDNRGHGDSTGTYVGFGVHESADASQVIDALETRGRLARPIGVLGGSLGAAAAIQLAARDGRVDTVVAVAPYARLDDVMESFAEAYNGMTKLVPGPTWTRYAEAVCDLAGITLEQTDNVAAAGRCRVPILLIAGDSDTHVPLKQTGAILAAAPAGSRLVTLPGESHQTLGRGKVLPIRDDVLTWFDEHLREPVTDAAPNQP